MRLAPIYGEFNKGLNFGNVATKNEEGADGGANSGRKRECCNCGGDHLNRIFLKLV